MTILGTGLTGLVGSRIVELLGNSYQFESSSADITNKEDITTKINSSNAEVVLHLAAKTNVDDCEKDKDKGKEGEAWKINVDGTRNVSEACLASGKKLIYISTDFVFDGEKNAPYTEEDVPHPINWYAKTKYEGEKAVQDICKDYLIARIAYPYRAKFERNDFARAIYSRLNQGQPVAAIEDHFFNPTFIDDVALGLDILLKAKSAGIYHLAGAQCLSPYDAAFLIADTFSLDKSLISKTTREEFFKDRAPRPFKLAMKNAKIEKLGFKTRTFEEGLQEIKKQLGL